MCFTKPPYLKHGRLADVVAAVQFIGAARRPEAEIAEWTERLSGSREQKEVKRWTAVFTEHPEFFHVYTLKGRGELKAALRVRYANRLYDAETETAYKPEDVATLEEDVKNRLTTKPFDGEMIAAMATTAISFHARASEDRTARRWWVPIFAAVLGFVGALSGAFLAAQKAEPAKKDAPVVTNPPSTSPGN